MRQAARRHVHPQGGFTLLEILMALAIVAVALGAIISEVGRHVYNTAQLRDRTIAHWIAMNIVAEQQINNKWPSVSTKKGETTMAGQEWFWTLTVTETADDRVRRLDVTVDSDKDSETPLSSLIAYLGRPAP
ncbi:MAG TPA: type II secretion system protein GspI [Gammaproteobacteria bacterium]|nr:type II secretion system protein GspI [Gammaproteobacteria bacterium]